MSEEVPAVTPPPTIFTATAEPLGITCKCGRFVHYTQCQSNRNGNGGRLVAIVGAFSMTWMSQIMYMFTFLVPWSRRERRGLSNNPMEARVVKISNSVTARNLSRQQHPSTHEQQDMSGQRLRAIPYSS